MRSRGFDLVGFLPNYPYSPRPSRESGRGRALCTLRVRRLDREPNIGKKWGPADPEQPEPARPRDRREIDFGADTLWRDPSSPERGTCDHRTRRTNDGRLPSGRGSRPSRNRRRGAGTPRRRIALGHRAEVKRLPTRPDVGDLSHNPRPEICESANACQNLGKTSLHVA